MSRYVCFVVESSSSSTRRGAFIFARMDRTPGYLAVLPTAVAVGSVLALFIFVVTLASVLGPPFGVEFIAALASISPPLPASSPFFVLAAAGYALIAGLIMGLLYAILYNALTGWVLR